MNQTIEISSLLSWRPTLSDQEEVTSAVIGDAVTWMEFVSGALRSTDVELEFVAQIVDRCRQDILKLSDVENDPTSEFQSLLERATKAIKNADKLLSEKRLKEFYRQTRSNEIVNQIADEQIRLSRIKLEHGIVRAPVVWIPFTVLLATIGFAMFGVFQINNQKFDINSMVDDKIETLTTEITEKQSTVINQITRLGDRASDEIDKARKEALTAIEAQQKELSEAHAAAISQIESTQKLVDEAINVRRASALERIDDRFIAIASAMDEKIDAETSATLADINDRVSDALDPTRLASTISSEIQKEVGLAVFEERKAIALRLERRAAEFDSSFSEQKIKEALDSSTLIDEKISDLSARVSKIFPEVEVLEKALKEVRSAKPDEIDLVLSLSRHAEKWAFAVYGAIGFLITFLFVLSSYAVFRLIAGR